MVKTILVFKNIDGTFVSNDATVKLYGPLDNSPGYKTPTVLDFGVRVFEDLKQGSYNVFINNDLQEWASPMWLSGPEAIVTYVVSPNSINTSHLIDQSVTALKIASQAIDNGDKIKNGIIELAHLKDGVFGTAQIQDAAVTKNKLGGDIFSSNFEYASGGYKVKVDDLTIEIDSNGKLKVKSSFLSTAMIADNAITANKIINGAVTANKIADNAVTEDKIADNAVTTNKIKNDTITGEKISKYQIVQDHIEPNFLAKLKGDILGAPGTVAFVSPNYTEVNGFSSPYFPNIQEAIAFVESQDNDARTIYVYSGTYYGPFYVTDDLNIVGVDNNSCILEMHRDDSAEGLSSILAVNTGDSKVSLTLENLTIRGFTTSYSLNVLNIENTSNELSKIRIIKSRIRLEASVLSSAATRTLIGVQYKEAELELNNSSIEIIANGRDLAPVKGIGIKDLNSRIMKGRIILKSSEIKVAGGKGVWELIYDESGGSSIYEPYLPGDPLPDYNLAIDYKSERYCSVLSINSILQATTPIMCRTKVSISTPIDLPGDLELKGGVLVTTGAMTAPLPSGHFTAGTTSNTVQVPSVDLSVGI